MSNDRPPIDLADLYVDQVANSLIATQGEVLGDIIGLVQRLAPSAKVLVRRQPGGTGAMVVLETAAGAKNILVTCAFAEVVSRGVCEVRVVENWNPQASQILVALVEEEAGRSSEPEQTESS